MRRPGVGFALRLLVRRSLRQHALATVVTMLCVALGSGLVMAVFSIQKQAEDAFTGGPIGFDAVLGARGSQLQLVLNTVFHLETSPGNISWSLYDEVRKRPYVELAIPYAVGDNYRGFRIVGTTPELFTKFEYQAARKFTIVAPGRAFEPEYREAVIGSAVARATGLTLGSRLNPYHGVNFDERARHPEEYVVVGVMDPTNSPSDRVVWIPIEGFFRLKDHTLRGGGREYIAQPGEQIPDEHKEVSAVMIKLRSPQGGTQLFNEVNHQGKIATLAWPIGNTMAEIFRKLGWVSRVLELVAYLVIFVAAASILATIYNTINERRREFAILRALGAGRKLVFSAIVLEAAAVAGIGSVLGYAVYGAILVTAAAIVREQTGVALGVLAWHPMLWLTPPLMIGLGACAGVFPALRAYATDVASNLAPSS